MGMKKQLLRTIAELRDRNIDFQKTPPLFTWGYEEEPDIEFQMLIVEKKDQLELPLNNTIH
jgi:hypothetical protein